MFPPTNANGGPPRNYIVPPVQHPILYATNQRQFSPFPTLRPRGNLSILASIAFDRFSGRYQRARQTLGQTFYWVNVCIRILHYQSVTKLQSAIGLEFLPLFFLLFCHIRYLAFRAAFLLHYLDACYHVMIV